MQALKQAKISLAMQRAALKKAQQAGADDNQLAPLRAAVRDARETMDELARHRAGLGAISHEGISGRTKRLRARRERRAEKGYEGRRSRP